MQSESRGTQAAPVRARLSVVIPAHQEEGVVGRCLDAFWPDLRDEAQVVVVANGCTDRTAEVARARAGVGVVELAEGSKRLALDAGDLAVAAYPRIYLDADVVVTAAALRAVADVLRGPGPRAAAPRVHFVVDGRPWLIRAFYAAYSSIPYTTQGLVGLGLYGVSADGRARFGSFPDVTSDDLFVQRTFGDDERVVVEDHRFQVETPRTMRSLLAVRTRTAQGNSELAGSGEKAHGPSTGRTVGALARRALRDPSTLPAAVVYTVVVLLARLRARTTPASWHRDDSTR
ncbi:glycosyltransferase [uncultured Pseudokineococcus sp.]|uniref:glycosyltransferase n=1 Tax=uncultured Pseudokineococcus sp. TaxID=1642928 RepID=UPI0026242AFA|nr:glycosyltransferase [uncultured Pseudokineococcus sp.]